MAARKTIGLVAHDNRKKDLTEWAEWNYKVLTPHRLVCTGTTGLMVEAALQRKLDDECEAVGFCLDGPDGFYPLGDLSYPEMPEFVSVQSVEAISDFFCGYDLSSRSPVCSLDSSTSVHKATLAGRQTGTLTDTSQPAPPTTPRRARSARRRWSRSRASGRHLDAPARRLAGSPRGSRRGSRRPRG